MIVPPPSARYRIPKARPLWNEPGVWIAGGIVVAAGLAMWGLVHWIGQDRASVYVARPHAAGLIFERERMPEVRLDLGRSPMPTLDRDVRQAVAIQPIRPGLLEMAGASWVTHEIRYELPEAGEVHLGWGIDGWKPVPEPVWPVGTVKKEWLSTPMTLKDGFFAVAVKVPVGALINYGFWIAKSRDGRDIGVWDGNGYPAWGYQAVARAGGTTVVTGSAAVFDDQRVHIARKSP